MSPAETLRTVTCHSARYLNLPRSGEVKAGYAADLILLEGNPLEDLHYLRRPVAVLKAGRMMAGHLQPARGPASSSAAMRC